MKKIYINPTIEIIDEASAQLMAGSGVVIPKGTDEAGGGHSANSKQQSASFDDFEDDNDNALYKTYELFK